MGAVAAGSIRRPPTHQSPQADARRHGVYCSPESEIPVFLDVLPGMRMIVKHDYLSGEKAVGM